MVLNTPTKGSVSSSLRNSIAKALSEVEDPTSREKRQVTYMREPDTASDGFDGHPYLYVENRSVQMEAATMNGNVFEVPVTVEIVIEAEDKDVEKKKHFNDLTDQMIGIFVIDRRYDLERNNRSTTVQQEGKPVIRREMVFSFDLVMRLDS